MTLTEAKRRILQAQPGKTHHYNSASVDVINCEFAAYCARKHPGMRLDQQDSFAIGTASAMQAQQDNARVMPLNERTDSVLTAPLDDTPATTAKRAILMREQPGFRDLIASLAPAEIDHRFNAYAAKRGAGISPDPKVQDGYALAMWANMRNARP